MIETHNFLKRSQQEQNLQSFTFIGGTASDLKCTSVKPSPLLGFPQSMFLQIGLGSTITQKIVVSLTSEK